MLKTLFILLLLQTSVVQTDYPVKKLWLFSKTVYNGTVPKLPGGGQAKGYYKKMLCYIEVGKDQPMPAWQTAVLYGKQYVAEAVPVAADSVAVGVIKNTHSAVVIKAETGYKLVELMLTKPIELEKPEACPVMLSGILNGKPATVRAKDTPVELAPEMMP